ncbi:MAG: hypothetical protein HY548_09355 [Elusimicrobia bacterium]|nr:hypothetical protein [Elusimicrobiota bacterium]
MSKGDKKADLTPAFIQRAALAVGRELAESILAQEQDGMDRWGYIVSRAKAYLAVVDHAGNRKGPVKRDGRGMPVRVELKGLELAWTKISTDPAYYVLDLAEQVAESQGKPLTIERLKAAIEEDSGVEVPLTDVKKFFDRYFKKKPRVAVYTRVNTEEQCS